MMSRRRLCGAIFARPPAASPHGLETPWRNLEEAPMKRKANARWQGDLQSGTGAVSTASGALSDTAYDFRARFEDGSGTNPEELLGAAHAGCYAMALSMILGQAGHTPERIDAEATVSLEQQDDGF